MGLVFNILNCRLLFSRLIRFFNCLILKIISKHFSRYCELCGLSGKVENGLNRGKHKFLPELAQGQESAFAPHCGKISTDSYEFKRTINLPTRKELENMIKGKVQGVDDEIKKRLNKGVRKLVSFRMYMS